MTTATPSFKPWLAGLLALGLALAACSDSSSDATADTTASSIANSGTEEPADSETEESMVETPDDDSTVSEPVRLTDKDPDDNIALFTISDSNDIAFTISNCAGAGESTVAFQGESEAGTSVSVDATDMVGGVTIDGPEGSFEGTIDVVIVGDTGWTTVSGTASVADDSATGGPMKFSISGFVCS